MTAAKRSCVLPGRWRSRCRSTWGAAAGSCLATRYLSMLTWSGSSACRMLWSRSAPAHSTALAQSRRHCLRLDLALLPDIVPPVGCRLHAPRTLIAMLGAVVVSVLA